jgi:hypothetical protein
MAAKRNMLADAFANPEAAREWSPSDWLAIVRRAQRRALGAKLAMAIQAVLDEEELAPATVRQFVSEERLALNNRRETEAEAFYVLRALRHLDRPVVFLKGAAYALADLKVAAGRLASDVDILVHEADIEITEQTFVSKGWTSMKSSEYDDAYYRQWMHEIPPLVHPRRGRVVDLHHTILPRTSRFTPDAKALIEAAVPVELAGMKALCLCPADMVIHAAIHTFYDGDLEERLRDILDIHELLVEFSAVDGFWGALRARTALHGAGRPVFYALYFCQELFNTDVPSDALSADAPGRPNALLLGLMDWLITKAAPPRLPEHRNFLPRLAVKALYIRSHWLRMPPLMLARHLATKFIRSFMGKVK